MFGRIFQEPFEQRAFAGLPFGIPAEFRRNSCAARRVRFNL
jgi:hypothetical protein